MNSNTITLLYRETNTPVDLESVDALWRYFGVGVGELFEFSDSPDLSGKSPLGDMPEIVCIGVNRLIGTWDRFKC